MIKTVEIVSLSSGTIGEPFAAHELEIGVKRLQAMGLQVKFAEHALKGIEYIKDHPEDRASDLLEAYADPEVDSKLDLDMDAPDYLLCNDTPGYADLILDGDPETYLKTVTEYKTLDS